MPTDLATLVCEGGGRWDCDRCGEVCEVRSVLVVVMDPKDFDPMQASDHPGVMFCPSCFEAKLLAWIRAAKVMESVDALPSRDEFLKAHKGRVH